MAASKLKKMRERAQIDPKDTWNLSHIFRSDRAWEQEFTKIQKEIEIFTEFAPTISSSPQALADCLTFNMKIEKRLEKIGSYAFLKMSQDLTNGTYQGMVARYTTLATKAEELSSYIQPGIMSIPQKKIPLFLQSECLAPFQFQLEQILRYRQHTLSKKEERILAMQGEVAQSAQKIYQQLCDADFKFGTVRDDKGDMVELTQGNWGGFLENQQRSVRKKSFEKMFGVFESYANTLATTYNASVLQDVYQSKVRNFDSCVSRSLYRDNVPLSVYDNLVQSVRDHIEINHRYLDLHQKVLKIKDLHFYDSYVPLVKDSPWKSSYEKSASTILDALSPLGKSYCNILKKGLGESRWVDKYENKGKRSGAFSAGGYDVPPYILMNYDAHSMRGIYTLAHEAGHSMHTYLSAKNQEFPNYDYTIFVAEVASTFNEQLLTRHLLATASSKKVRAYIIDREINQIRATLIRQTMFAEFERITHRIVENNEALTLDRLSEEYTSLVQFYFGPNFTMDKALAIEWARIPHFYSAFYVYKYATGIAAAYSLSERVSNGGKNERDAYLHFLKSGGSDYPLNLLQKAGVDLSTPAPVELLMKRFSQLIDELEQLLGHP